MHNLTVTVQSGQKYHTFIAVFAALPAVPNQYGVKNQEMVYHLIGSWCGLIHLRLVKSVTLVLV